MRQGCFVSPLLFNIIVEQIMRIVEDKLENRHGTIIGGRCIWNIRYADDTTMVATSREKCSEMGGILKETSEQVGLKINRSKTQVLAIHGEGDVEIQRETIEKVRKVKFLGSYITTNGDSTDDIKSRIGRAKAIAISMSEIWKSRELSKRLD